MEKQSNFEKIYKSYKMSSDKVLIINGVEYFKIIEKNKVDNYQIIVIPMNVFYAKGNRLKDEKGNIFTVGNPATYSFREDIPKWYIETASVMLKDTTIDKIGDYVALAE